MLRTCRDVIVFAAVIATSVVCVSDSSVFVSRFPIAAAKKSSAQFGRLVDVIIGLMICAISTPSRWRPWPKKHKISVGFL